MSVTVANQRLTKFLVPKAMAFSVPGFIRLIASFHPALFPIPEINFGIRYIPAILAVNFVDPLRL
ncbi:hypothetical protein [Pedosphaera parvula]|uniref:hypothetical protein n=1 Tax=Pedosphaera parvula TaxID=1032527 RepID=UPI00058F4B4E|nr:hypothetical protein [Pedosphaera parvula]